MSIVLMIINQINSTDKLKFEQAKYSCSEVDLPSNKDVNGSILFVQTLNIL